MAVEGFNPTWLVVARQSRGMTQKELADALAINQGWLSRIEADLRPVSEEVLGQLSGVLGYPTDFFRQPEPPHLSGLTDIFHRKLAVPNKLLDKVNGELIIIGTALDRLLDGIEIDGGDLATVDLDEFRGSIEDVARRVRVNFGMPRGPVPNVTKLLESARAIVIPFDFGTRRIDATSLWLPKSRPLFFVNTAVPGDRLRFTLCHELGHIVMHQGTLRDGREEEANRFAAEFLMPASQIESYLANLSLSKLASLKIQWRVSMAALLKRAQSLETISFSQAKNLWMQMSRYKQREPPELDVPVEAPTLFGEIVGAYQHELGYDLAELSKLLRLSEADTTRFFVDPPQFDVVAAIEEAERLIRGQ